MEKLQFIVEQHLPLIDVACSVELEMKSGGFEFNEINFIFSGIELLLKSLPNTDEIDIRIKKSNNDGQKDKVKRSNMFSEYIGMNLIESWFCQNSRGYTDLLVLSFDLMLPNFAVYSIGSTLSVYKLARL